MGRGAKIFWMGFAIAFITFFIPMIGLVGAFVGSVMMIWGGWLFWFGAAKGVVKGGAKAVRAASGDKTGSGTL